MSNQPPQFDWDLICKVFLCLKCFRPMKVARETTLERHLRFCMRCRNMVEIKRTGKMFEYVRP